jgi:predicted Fe-Mo cluster-binding NifX family protein
MILLVFHPASAMGEEMVIAVASDGKSPAADVSGIAARCNYFLIFDGGGKLKEVGENPYKDARGSAGTSAASFLAGKEVTIIVAGRFGDKMKDALAAHKIAIMEFSGSIEDAISKILER